MDLIRVVEITQTKAGLLAKQAISSYIPRGRDIFLQQQPHISPQDGTTTQQRVLGPACGSKTRPPHHNTFFRLTTKEMGRRRHGLGRIRSVH